MVNKFKVLIPVILLIIFSTRFPVGGWGEIKQFKAPKIDTPDYVEVGIQYPIKITFDKKAISDGMYSLYVAFPENYGQRDISLLITNEFYQFQTKAPTLEGLYVIRVDVNNDMSQIVWTGSAEVRVLYNKEPTTSSVVGGIVMEVLSFPVKFIIALFTAPAYYGPWR